MICSCEVCGQEGHETEFESTCCGSICPGCLEEHAEQCEVCRQDFIKYGLIESFFDEGDTGT